MIESILWTTMTVRLVDQTTSDNHESVIPEGGATSHIMSGSEFYFVQGRFPAGLMGHTNLL